MLGRIDVDNGYDAFSLDNGRDTLSDQPGRDKHDANFGSLGLNWYGSERFGIETIATYANSKIDYGYDEDWVYVGFDPAEYSSTDDYRRDRRTGTLEVQLFSEPAGRLFGGTTDWVVGTYVLTSDVKLNRDYTFLPSRFSSDYEVLRYAAFGQLESRLSERVTLIGGLRYERHDSKYHDSNDVRFDPDDDLYGGRLSLEYLLSDGLMGYVSAAKGYKAGGFNTLGTLDEDLREYDPEDLYNLEVGVKGRVLGDRLGARVAGFYMWRDNMQVESSVVRPRPDGSSEFVQFVGNASDGVNYGMEAELEYLATDRLTLFANLGLLFTRYKDYVNAAGENLDGRDQAQAPKYQFFTSARYRFGGGYFVNVEAEGKDSFYFSDNHDQQSDSYELYNLSAGYEGDGWTVTFWGRNLTDKDYFVRGFYFGNDPRTGYEPALYTQLGEPRRYGVTVDWRL
jgi:outer membrane receptor protein involved in Fe transport